MSKRINSTFDRLKKQGKKAFVSYVMGCDPSREATEKLLPKLAESGVDIIELGMAFSDPAAEGPTIQAAAIRALENKSDVKTILEITKNFRKTNTETPIILMGYFNPIFSYGCEKFVEDCISSGVDGLIIVDLPPEEENEIIDHTVNKDLSLIKLATPTTNDSRLEKILQNSSGFLYYVSVAGVTGQKQAVKEQVKQQVDFIKSRTDLPVCVGFGIKDEQSAKDISSTADGIVIGSAFVNILERNKEDIDLAVEECAQFSKRIRAAID